MPSRLSKRAVLPPPGHSAVYEARVETEARLGSKAKPLHDSGSKTLDERVGLPDETQCQVATGGRFEIEGNRTAIAQEEIEVAWPLEAKVGIAFAIDPQNACPQICQQHGAHRRGAERPNLDNAHTSEGPFAGACG